MDQGAWHLSLDALRAAKHVGEQAILGHCPLPAAHCPPEAAKLRRAYA